MSKKQEQTPMIIRTPAGTMPPRRITVINPPPESPEPSQPPKVKTETKPENAPPKPAETKKEE